MKGKTAHKFVNLINDRRDNPFVKHIYKESPLASTDSIPDPFSTTKLIDSEQKFIQKVIKPILQQKFYERYLKNRMDVINQHNVLKWVDEIDEIEGISERARRYEFSGVIVITSLLL